MSHLVGNPEDRFSRVAAQIKIAAIVKLKSIEPFSFSAFYSSEDLKVL